MTKIMSGINALGMHIGISVIAEDIDSSIKIISYEDFSEKLYGVDDNDSYLNNCGDIDYEYREEINIDDKKNINYYESLEYLDKIANEQEDDD